MNKEDLEPSESATKTATPDLSLATRRWKSIGTSRSSLPAITWIATSDHAREAAGLSEYGVGLGALVRLALLDDVGRNLVEKARGEIENPGCSRELIPSQSGRPVELQDPRRQTGYVRGRHGAEIQPPQP